MQAQLFLNVMQEIPRQKEHAVHALPPIPRRKLNRNSGIGIMLIITRATQSQLQSEFLDQHGTMFLKRLC